MPMSRTRPGNVPLVALQTNCQRKVGTKYIKGGLVAAFVACLRSEHLSLLQSWTGAAIKLETFFKLYW